MEPGIKSKEFFITSLLALVSAFAFAFVGYTNEVTGNERWSIATPQTAIGCGESGIREKSQQHNNKAGERNEGSGCSHQITGLTLCDTQSAKRKKFPAC